MSVTAVDRFTAHRSLGQNPAEHAFEITPNDDDDVPYVSRFLYAGGTGDIKLITCSGETVLFKAVPAGTIIPVRARRVLSAGTSANMYLVGLY
jgi:hypothetical protein